jgi:uncharacterized protein YbaP (TraB family)
LSLDLLSNFKIWSLANSLPILEAGFGAAKKVTVDEAIAGVASDYRKEIGGLETPEEQILVFDSLKKDEQINLLEQMLDYMEYLDSVGRNPVEEYYDAYLSGSEDQILQMVYEGLDENDPLTEKIISNILIERNHKIKDRIVEKINENADKSYFFAVGVGHFVGEENIIELLEKEGFTVERVTG